MEPIGFLLGVGTFGLAVKLKRPLRRVAVITAGQVLGIVDRLKATAYGFKEEMEDIIAEAQYENMKKNLEINEESEDTEDDIKSEGGTENGNN